MLAATFGDAAPRAYDPLNWDSPGTKQDNRLRGRLAPDASNRSAPAPVGHAGHVSPHATPVVAAARAHTTALGAWPHGVAVAPPANQQAGSSADTAERSRDELPIEDEPDEDQCSEQESGSDSGTARAELADLRAKQAKTERHTAHIDAGLRQCCEQVASLKRGQRTLQDGQLALQDGLRQLQVLLQEHLAAIPAPQLEPEPAEFAGYGLEEGEEVQHEDQEESAPPPGETPSPGPSIDPHSLSPGPTPASMLGAAKLTFPKFSEGRDVDYFFTSAERYFRLCGVHRSIWVSFTLTHMPQYADWWDAHAAGLAEHLSSDWEHFVQVIKGFCNMTNKPVVARNKLLRIAQGSTPLASYNSTFLRLMRDSSTAPTEPWLVSAYLNGLSDATLRRAVTLHNGGAWHDVTHLVQHVSTLTAFDRSANAPTAHGHFRAGKPNQGNAKPSYAGALKARQPAPGQRPAFKPTGAQRTGVAPARQQLPRVNAADVQPRDSRKPRHSGRGRPRPASHPGFTVPKGLSRAAAMQYVADKLDELGQRG